MKLVFAGGGPRHFSTSAADACWRRMRPWRMAMAGFSAVAQATGLARSTINRGIRELRLGRNEIGKRVRRAGGGRKSAVVHQPNLPAALEALIEDAIRGDPGSPLRWVSRSLRHLVRALAAQGFQASQRVVANLLRQLNYSCQANRKTREGANHPDSVRPHQCDGEGGNLGWRAGDLGGHQEEGTRWGLQEQRTRTTLEGQSRTGAGARL